MWFPLIPPSPTPKKKLKKKHHPFVKPLGIKVVLVTSLCIASKTKVGRRDGSCVSSVAEFVGKTDPHLEFLVDNC